MVDKTIHDVLADDEITTTTVESEVTVEEIAAFDHHIEDEYGCVVVTAKYPEGKKRQAFPFFENWLLPGNTASSMRLEQIVRFDSDAKREPTIAAFYMDGNTAAVVSRMMTDEYPSVEAHDQFKRRVWREEETKLWDAEWEETTDPLIDVQLSDTELECDERANRPWEE
jgi:hypothetical protein